MVGAMELVGGSDSGIDGAMDGESVGTEVLVNMAGEPLVTLLSVAFSCAIVISAEKAIIRNRNVKQRILIMRIVHRRINENPCIIRKLSSHSDDQLLGEPLC